MTLVPKSQRSLSIHSKDCIWCDMLVGFLCWYSKI